MPIFHGLDDPRLPRGAVVSIGNFDGVHLGHQALIEHLLVEADRRHRPSLVLTFDPPPMQVLAPERCPPQLTTVEVKSALLLQTGVDAVVVYPTDRELLDLSPHDFFQRIVRDRLQASGLVEGPNFYFGKNRAGDVAMLKDLCDEGGLSLHIVPQRTIDGRMTSSTAIREALSQGDIHSANEMLGRPYTLSGKVIPGAGRGRSLGFPTANLGHLRTMIPGDGVYAAWALLSQKRWPAAVHIGPNPTFSETQRKVEVHLIGFEQQLYNEGLTIEFVDRVRSVKKFDSEDQIISQIEQDLLLVQALLS